MTLNDCGDTLRMRELAEVLGVSVRTIQRERQARIFPIPPLRKHGHPRWSKAAVARYLDAAIHRNKAVA